MNAMSDYRTVYIRGVLPPKPERKPIVPVVPYHIQALMDNAAVKIRDRTGGKFASDLATIIERRLEWLSSLPEGPFDRVAARASWDIAESAADNRVDVLERAGMLKRVSVKPIQWVKA